VTKIPWAYHTIAKIPNTLISFSLEHDDLDVGIRVSGLGIETDRTPLILVHCKTNRRQRNRNQTKVGKNTISGELKSNEGMSFLNFFVEMLMYLLCISVFGSVFASNSICLMFPDFQLWIFLLIFIMVS